MAGDLSQFTAAAADGVFHRACRANARSPGPLKAVTPESLNPEELTLLDPACGSGHILVEAYDIFKAIYQERGYRAKDIPRLILERNLFGLEIDDRAHN